MPSKAKTLTDRMFELELEVRGNGNGIPGLIKDVRIMKGQIMTEEHLTLVIDKAAEKAVQKVITNAKTRDKTTVELIKAYGPFVAALSAVAIAVIGKL